MTFWSGTLPTSLLAIKVPYNIFLSKTWKGDHIPIPLVQGFSIWALRLSEAIFSCGGCTVLCKIFNSFSGLYLLEASCIPPVAIMKNVSRHYQMSQKWHWGKPITPSWEPLTYIQFLTCGHKNYFVKSTSYFISYA